MPESALGLLYQRPERDMPGCETTLADQSEGINRPPSYDSAKNSRAYEGLTDLMRLQLMSCQNDSRAYKSPRNKISAAAPAAPAKRFPRIRKARSRSCSLLRAFAYLTRRSAVTAQRRVTR